MTFGDKLLTKLNKISFVCCDCYVTATSFSFESGGDAGCMSDGETGCMSGGDTISMSSGDAGCMYGGDWKVYRFFFLRG